MIKNGFRNSRWADHKIQGLETGADAYVEKPFNVEVLKATINNLIKSRKNISNVLEENDVKKQLTPDEYSYNFV